MRPVNHFFDPYNNRGIDICPPVIPQLCYTSPEWALEMFQDIYVQGSSLRHMRAFLRDGLSLPQEQEREVRLGTFFRAIGHVIHHVQDMAQPQHSRADSHLFFLPWEYSQYEKFTGECDDAVFDVVMDNYPIPDTFRDAQDFWNTIFEGVQETGGQGLAEFTNQNFISEDTNFRGTVDGVTHVVTTKSGDPMLPHPDANGTTLETPPFGSVSLDCGAFQYDPIAPPNGAVLGFVRTTVNDAFTGQSILNRTSAVGLLAADVAQTAACASDPHNCPATFTENVYTFEAYAKLLLPRAVAYSAGLINHFFGGVVRPDGSPSLRLKASRLTNEDGTLVITNHSGRTLQSGTFSVFYDDRTTGLREPAGSVSLTGPVTAGTGFVIAQGQGVDLSRFWTDGDPSGQVAIIFEGVAGNMPNEEEEIIAARVCDCGDLLTESLDDALLDCSGVCPCAWLDFVDGNPVIPGDGQTVSGTVVGLERRKMFTLPDCVQASALIDEVTITVFPTAANVGIGNGVTVFRALDDEECPASNCGGPEGNGGGSQVTGETMVNGVRGWVGAYDPVVSPAEMCAGEIRARDDLHSLGICFTNQVSCGPFDVDCCEPAVDLDGAMICFAPNVFPTNPQPPLP